MTAMVFLIAAVTRCTAGAWVSLLIVAAFTAVALLTRRHFDRVAGLTALRHQASSGEAPEEIPSQVSNHRHRHGPWRHPPGAAIP